MLIACFVLEISIVVLFVQDLLKKCNKKVALKLKKSVGKMMK